ncbi:MAG: hypothetical protein AB7U29_00110 [Desulfobulbus sp.]
MVRRGIVLIALLLVAAPALAESLVQGRYVAEQENSVSLQITVQHPAPAAFIIIQKMARGLSLVTATPPPVGGRQDGTAVKWFFKRPRSGQFVVNMQFAQPVTLNQLEGSISYRHPETGSLVLSRIRE